MAHIVPSTTDPVASVRSVPLTAWVSRVAQQSESLLEPEPWHSRPLSVCPWAGYLTSLCSGHLINKVELIIPPCGLVVRVKYISPWKAVGGVSGAWHSVSDRW